MNSTVALLNCTCAKGTDVRLEVECLGKPLKVYHTSPLVQSCLLVVPLYLCSYRMDKKDQISDVIYPNIMFCVDNFEEVCKKDIIHPYTTHITASIWTRFEAMSLYV